MIPRLRRLERVRARQLDHARADHVRATVACERAEDDRRAAIAGFDAQVGKPLAVTDLEDAYARIDQCGAQVVRAQAVQERTRVRTAAAGNAWNRADQALAHARAERMAKRLREEQREHDELSARRSK
ncbi:MAG TPA: hypothetical protein VG755_29320 [Nannocystaceae bacterium]|nr:hypothetical protein [Nannocystaceae bacterium]